MSDIDEFHARFRAFDDVIHLAYHKLQDGEVVPLAALEQDVELLCQDLQKLEPSIARGFQPIVAEMIAKLDDLASLLQDHKRALQQQDG